MNMSLESFFDSKVINSIAAILNLLLIAIPKDLWRWLNLKPKCVQNQVILITGAGSGLGQRMAEIFALELGAKVAIFDIDKTKAKSVANNIKAKSGIAEAWKCNVADANSINKATAEVRKVFGSIDICICNAGILYFGHTLQLKTEELQNALNVNVMGTINTIRAVLYEMETKNSGQIVSISSIAGYYGETFGMAYCPTKFAVRGIMECLRMELLDRKVYGISCTTLCPYFVRTPMILNMGMRPTSRLISFMSIERCSQKIIDAILKEKILAFVPSWICLMPMVTTLLSVNMLKTARDYLNCHYEPLKSKNYNCDRCKKTIKSFADIHNKEKNNAKIDKEEKQIGNKYCCCLTKSDNNLNSNENSTINSKSNKCEKNFLTFKSLRKMSNYFKAPNPIWYLIIPPALALTFFIWYSPEIFDVPYLYEVGKFFYAIGVQHKTLLSLINIGALIAHIGEAYYALIICNEMELTHVCGLKWFTQTFVLGFPSLRLLLAYQKKKKLSK